MAVEYFPHCFASPELAEQALAVRKQDGKKLEWLGDRILNLVLADLLLERHPQRSVGELSRAHSCLSSNDRLFQLGVSMGLPGHDRPDKNRKRLSDVVEALLGAVFLDAGYDKTRQCVQRMFAGWMDGCRWERDPKSSLKERCESGGLRLPEYVVARSNNGVFDASCTVAGASGRGIGRTTLAAETDAAAEVLAQLPVLGREDK